MDQRIKDFFAWSDLFDYMVTKKLSHIKSNWELIWDHDEEKYELEDDSYAGIINELIDELSSLTPPEKYHDSENQLAYYCKRSLKWDISKVGNRWIGAEYSSIGV